MEELIMNMHSAANCQDFSLLLQTLDHVLERNMQLANSITLDLIDTDFLDEIKTIVKSGNVGVYFGKSLRDLKIVLPDDAGLRSHDIFLQYKAHKKLYLMEAKLPHSLIQNREYRDLEELIEFFKKHINDLTRYFDELEHIDQFCTIMEPVNASFKDDYRRILLDDRTWLHVEVTHEGLATNVHLVGQSVYWHNKLQSGLLIWDHDKNIVDNIMAIFDLTAFPQLSTVSQIKEVTGNIEEEPIVCGICLCAELADTPGVPQPLCQNATCGVYYHRSCLYQWLVACAGSRPPAFGVANGACPTCLQPIACSEKDN